METPPPRPDRHASGHPGDWFGSEPEGSGWGGATDDLDGSTWREWDRPWEPARDTRLRTLVFLDGRLVDSRVESVAHSAYADLAARLERDDEERVARAVRLHTPSPPPPERHELVLRWLDDVVGGRVALLALDDEPLPEVPVAGDDPVAVLADRVCRRRFDEELAAAALTALATLRGLREPALDGRPAAVAAGLCWLLGRVNGVVGAGTGITLATVKQELGVNVQPSAVSGRLRAKLVELRPDPVHRPPACPDLLELGRSDLLTSATRRRLIDLRDRALDVAATLAADDHARAVLGSPGADRG